MDADQLASTTMDRRYRTLRRVQLARRRAAPPRVFELLMGNDVAPRKEFIVDRRTASREASTATASTR